MDKGTTRLVIDLKAFKKAVSKKVKVDRLIMFGSAASGRLGKHSDIDLLLVSKNFEGVDYEERGPPLYWFWTLDRSFDLICLTPREVKARRASAGIVKEAFEEGVEI